MDAQRLGFQPQRKKLDPYHPHEVIDELVYNLTTSVVGQPHGVKAMSNAIMNGIFTDGIAEQNRPIANLLFLGPTGTGKTVLAKMAAKHLHGEPKMVRVDCQGMQASHEISVLIGSPPGYVDREVKPRLSQNFINEQRSKKHPITILLFDEIEKASYRLFNLLLNVMDEGTITLNDNSVTSFQNCILVFTSNVGAKEMRNILSSNIGFGSGQNKTTNKTVKQIEDAARRAAEKRFPPEFFNRFSEVVVFNQLGENHCRQILDLELKYLQERMANSTPPTPIVFTEAAKNFILQKGLNPQYGARPLRNTIHHQVVLPLKRIVNTRQIRPEEEVVVDWDGKNDNLDFYSQPCELKLILSGKTADVSEEFISSEFLPVNCKVGKDGNGRIWKLKPGMLFLGYAKDNIPEGGTVILTD